MKLYVCTSCTARSAEFIKEADTALTDLEITPVECMSGCARAQTVAFRAQGKVAYLFGEITAADFPDLQNFAQRYKASPDGTFTDARVLGSLRSKAIARIPA